MIQPEISMAEVFRRRADVTEAFARGLPSPMECDGYLRLARGFRDLAQEEAQRSRTVAELAAAEAPDGP